MEAELSSKKKSRIQKYLDTYEDKAPIVYSSFIIFDKCTKPKQRYEYFIQLLSHFPYHSFLAKWQREQLDSLLENLPLDQAVCTQDHSEGYACCSQDENLSEYLISTKSVSMSPFCTATQMKKWRNL